MQGSHKPDHRSVLDEESFTEWLTDRPKKDFTCQEIVKGLFLTTQREYIYVYEQKLTSIN
jgi:hypothetical protein